MRLKVEIVGWFLEGWEKRKGKDITKGTSCILLTGASSSSDLSAQSPPYKIKKTKVSVSHTLGQQ